MSIDIKFGGLSLVPLEMPLGRSTPQAHLPRQIPLREGPPLIRSRNGSRWHRVRDGRVLRDLITDQTYIVYGLWCGGSRFASKAIVSDVIPDSEDLCGPCEGKAVGAGHPSLVGLPPDAPLIFSPRRLDPPQWCPGWKRSLFAEIEYNVGRCLACQRIQPIRWSGGWMGSTNIVKHSPGPDLLAGCELHAWDELIEFQGAALCRCLKYEYDRQFEPKGPKDD